MKNKNLGKILLCTTLALATPFAMVGCSKKADNTPDNTPEEQQTIARNYVKEVTWPTTAQSVNKTEFADDNALRATLIEFMGNPYSNVPDNLQPGDENYELLVAKQYYPQALTNLVNQYIKDADGQSVNSEVSAKYVYTVSEDMIANFDQNHTVEVQGEEPYTGLKAYYEEYFNAYAKKYTDDTAWEAIEGTVGVFHNVNEDRTEDVMIGFEYNSSEKTITIYEMSFSKGGIEAAWEAIGDEMENEIMRLYQADQE